MSEEGRSLLHEDHLRVEEKDAPTRNRFFVFGVVVLAGVSAVMLLTSNGSTDMARIRAKTIMMSESNTIVYSELSTDELSALFEEFKSTYDKVVRAAIDYYH